VQAQKSLGDIAYKRGALDQALKRYQRVVELDPEFGDDVYAKLGELQYRARNREGAIRNWRRALELNPGNDVVRNNLEIVAHV
jgi:tetratricopeptide (TPR) repeat protein